jgi:tetratricopeptide (TPR) repeat protein
MNKRIPAILFIYLALIVTPLSLSGQKAVADNTRYQNAIYEAYILNEMPRWERTLQEMEIRYRTHAGHALLADILLAQYGLTGYYLGVEQKDKAGHQIDKAMERLQELDNAGGHQALVYALSSAFTAFRIGLRPIRAMQLGPRSYRLLEQALEADPSHPQVWIEKGNSAFFTPSMFGGNKKEAIEHYKKAISLLEREMPNNYRWLYLSTLVSLANAYEITGQANKAIQTLEKALAFEPRFRWVKEEMLPKLRAENP